MITLARKKDRVVHIVLYTLCRCCEVIVLQTYALSTCRRGLGVQPKGLDLHSACKHETTCSLSLARILIKNKHNANQSFQFIGITVGFLFVCFNPNQLHALVRKFRWTQTLLPTVFSGRERRKLPHTRGTERQFLQRDFLFIVALRHSISHDGPSVWHRARNCDSWHLTLFAQGLTHLPHTACWLPWLHATAILYCQIFWWFFWLSADCCSGQRLSRGCNGNWLLLARNKEEYNSKKLVSWCIEPGQS